MFSNKSEGRWIRDQVEIRASAVVFVNNQPGQSNGRDLRGHILLRSPRVACVPYNQILRPKPQPVEESTDFNSMLYVYTLIVTKCSVIFTAGLRECGISSEWKIPYSSEWMTRYICILKFAV